MKAIPKDDSILSINETFATLAFWLAEKKHLVFKCCLSCRKLKNASVSAAQNIVFPWLCSCSYYAGEKDSMIFDCTECYDPVTKQWTTVASMNYPRCGLGVCTCYSTIYALGKSGGFF